MKTDHRSEIVSDDRDLLVLVNADDEEVGLLDKVSCHADNGILHRAISVFLFNPNGDILLQQRHASKALWGGYWSNACCSHPRQQETTLEAAKRRVFEELGLSVPLNFCFKFQYQAAFNESHAEHELCSVFCGVTDRDPDVNLTEVNAWEWVSAQELQRRVENEPSSLTPWLKMEWEQLQNTQEC